MEKEYKNKCDGCGQKVQSRKFYTKIKLNGVTSEAVWPYLCRKCWENAHYAFKYRGDL